MAVLTYAQTVDNLYEYYVTLPAQDLLEIYDQATSSVIHMFAAAGNGFGLPPEDDVSARVAQHAAAKRAVLERLGQ